jgi:hypothetical protein
MQATGENRRIASIAQSDAGPIARILARAIAAGQRNSAPILALLSVAGDDTVQWEKTVGWEGLLMRPDAERSFIRSCLRDFPPLMRWRPTAD